MIFLLGFSGFVFLSYFFVLLFAYKQIDNADSKGIQDKILDQNLFTVIIPFRNEKTNLPNIYSDLLLQNYNKNYFEVILIDDHSTDGSYEWLQAKQMPTNFRLERSLGIGKKAAIQASITLATGNYIVGTDADCRLMPHWLEHINDSINSEKPILLVLPVISKPNKKLIDQFQYFDYLSIMGLNLASYKIKGLPALVAGANLVYSKKAFEQVNPFRDNMHIASGDDMFLLKAFIKRYSDRISLIYSSENLVITKPEKSWINLIFQRIRWVGKMKRFTGSISFFLGLLSFFVQVVMILLIILPVLLTAKYSFLFLCIWILKTSADYLFLKKTAQVIGHKIKWINVLALELVYMFFVPIILILSLVISPKWKARKVMG